MSYAFIRGHVAAFPVSAMCAALGVSRSGYYGWASRPEGARATADRALAAEIRAVHEGSRGRYGSPRVHAALRAHGRRVGRKRVARLMRGMGLSARRKRRFRRTTDSAHALPVAPNLLGRDFTAAAPDRVWLADLTYIWTAEGWLYLAVVLDLFSRRVVGWAMADHLGHELALAALDMAIARRRPAPGLIHHSDRGVQYAARRYQARLREHGMLCSMSRKGDCWDNAPMESFFATLKGELVEERDYLTHDEARADVFQYVEGFYNRRRLHSGIGYLTPERKAELAAAAQAVTVSVQAEQAHERPNPSTAQVRRAWGGGTPRSLAASAQTGTARDPIAFETRGLAPLGRPGEVWRISLRRASAARTRTGRERIGPRRRPVWRTPRPLR